MEFSLDKETGYLDWAFSGDKPNLSEEQAKIIAAAEQAEALRGIRDALHVVAKAISDAGSGSKGG